MIFVTVGTHEQPFNRLIKKIDELKKDGIINEDVIIQTGFSTYEPKYCQWSKLIPYCNHSRWPGKFYHATTDREDSYCCAASASV